MTDSSGLSYRSAGVDLDAAESTKERIKALVSATRDQHTLSELGLFGGLYEVPPDVEGPVLVSSADGVGTKLKVAFLKGKHDTVGQDLVNHCVNDILVQGARPLFFLDYLASGEMDEEVVAAVVEGMARGCLENRCVLLGGETAQMPDFYSGGEYDLAGFIVGVVAREALLDGSRISAGDVLIGLPSSGLHTNGYTLARKIVFEELGLSVDAPIPELEGETVGEALLRIHVSYLAPLSGPLAKGRLHGLAHITGGGIPGNLSRVLPGGLKAWVRTDSWEVPPLFQFLQAGGRVDHHEMFRVFNMGVGMICVTSAEDADGLVATLKAGGTDAWILGEVTAGEETDEDDQQDHQGVVLV